MAVKNILFDMDGTLLDTNELIIQSFKYTYKKHLNRLVDSEDIIKHFGEILNDTMDKEFGDKSEVAIKTYRDFQNINFDKLISINEGVKEGVKELHSLGYKLGIVTSRFRYSAIKGLKLFGLMDYFDVIIAADDTELHKPDPTPAFMALKIMDGKPEETMLVGDTQFDILCAKNAGIISAIVGWSALPIDVIRKYEPDYIIPSMEKLISLMEKSNN
ncbi:pyrophosphatase PpaX [Clostridium frigoris]|uniref:Pyrophosphatase PpaX n=1 Tax=Clostridium frigoris TaxID=205327 RepID=A0ABS6BSW4_9CLOT|nr:pyrophosphatase PpaX [Clostridium frigoris]MBU3160013.1 pyrophosphatase PpaX [Clostridium frigoris]